MKLQFRTLEQLKRVRQDPTKTQVWIDTISAHDLARALKELILQQRNGIPLDTDEQIIWEVIGKEIVGGNENEKAKEILRLKRENERLTQENGILREKNKQLIVKLV